MRIVISTTAFKLQRKTSYVMKKFIVLTFCLIFSSTISIAQVAVNDSESPIYFEFSELDFTKYAELHESVKSDGHFRIETVCIPAKVLCLQILDNRSTPEGFKQLAFLVGLVASELVQENPSQAFETRCQIARTGN